MIRLRLLIKDVRRIVKVAAAITSLVNRPEQVQIDITDRCNYRCPTCSKWRQNSEDGELTTLEWKKFIDSARGMPFSKRIVFSGGEPLLRHDIFELVEYASGQGYNTVLTSNGSLLNSETLSQLDTAGLHYLMVSLNSLNPSLHDETRGVKGSGDHIIEMIKTYKMIDRKVNLGISTIIMEKNLDHIVDLVDFVNKENLHGIMFQSQMDSMVHHPFRGHNHIKNKEEILFESHKMRQIIKKLLEMQKKGAPILNSPMQLREIAGYYQNPDQLTRIRCLAGLTSFLVDPYGDTRVCFNIDPIGNILEVDQYRKVWRSLKAKNARKQARVCKGECRIMNHIY